jgi:hypothetical protein
MLFDLVLRAGSNVITNSTTEGLAENTRASASFLSLPEEPGYHCDSRTDFTRVFLLGGATRNGK